MDFLIHCMCILVTVTVAAVVGLEPAAAAVKAKESWVVYTNSEEQEFALVEFRKLVAQDHLAYREFMRSDGYLARWLMQADFDVELALESFRKSVEWRRANRVDFVVFEDFSSLLSLDSALTFGLGNSFDKDGRPILWSPFGVYDSRRIALAGLGQSYQRFGILCYELSELLLHGLHANITQEVVIIDMAGFSLKTSACLKCVGMIPEFVTNFDSNYHQLLHKVFIINAPTIFHSPLNMAKQLLSVKNRDTIQVFGHDKAEWMAALQAQIPVDQLPVEYGGSKADITWRGKAARDDQRRKIGALVDKAREVVRKELLDGDGDGSGNDLELSEQDQQHHHYQTKSGPESNTSSNSSMKIWPGAANSSGYLQRQRQAICTWFNALIFILSFKIVSV